MKTLEMLPLLILEIAIYTTFLKKEGTFRPLHSIMYLTIELAIVVLHQGHNICDYLVLIDEKGMDRPFDFFVLTF